jgi:hypothetical protein
VKVPRRRLRESNPTLFETGTLPEYASTQEEIRRAVQRNAVQRGRFFALNLARHGFDEILDQIEALAREADLESWRDSAQRLGLDPRALDVLDRIPVPYPYYFCDPAQLTLNPTLVAYYRNVAMVSSKVMRGIGFDTAPHEAGMALSADKAEQLAMYFNSTVSALMVENPTLVTGRRHFEMMFTNLGESIGGSWRNEVGRLAYVEVVGMLLRYLHDKGCLSSVAYDLKGALDIEGEGNNEELTARDQLMDDGDDFLARLEEMEANRVVYKTISLRNGSELRLNRQIEWIDDQGLSHKIGPDLSAFSGADALVWGGELKGGADPAGSDEHWKTATRAFERILNAAEQTGRPKPKLSFIATILVDRVAREAALWIQQGKLTSAYNLTQMAESSEKRAAFLADLAEHLRCGKF